MSPGGAVDLYWLPLGAGGHSVRLNGKVYEALAAAAQRRPRRDLYHAGLEIRVGGERHVVEVAPVSHESRGAVAGGPVGARWAGRWRIFRYEVRRWRDGRIPDIAEAVDSPRHLTDDAATAARVLDTLPSVPSLVWGRDELRTGDMWNSNSVVAWALSRAGIDAGAIAPPPGGRAPGWAAGLELARRQAAAVSPAAPAA